MRIGGSILTKLLSLAASGYTMTITNVPIRDESIELDKLLKFAGFAGTGGHAKVLIQSGYVMVNDQVETRRRHKLAIGDVVQVQEQEALRIVKCD